MISILHPPDISAKSGSVVARLDTTGAELQEERSKALQHGLDPDVPVEKQPDPLEEAKKEAGSQVPPEQIEAGDASQQRKAIFRVYPDELWLLPRIQDRMRVIAEETEARERENVRRFGGQVKRTVENLMPYWEERFVGSLDYILQRRGGGGRRRKLVDKLHKAEMKLKKARKPKEELAVQVEALRRTYREKWQQEIDLAADQFVVLASNEALFVTVRQNARSFSIYGLPEGLEDTVEAAANPDTMAEDSTPVAESVVTFMAAVQTESGLQAKASNYPGHERHSPYIGNVEGVGKYSFDVDLGGLIRVNAEGFYEREPLIRFFLAVQRASRTTNIAWIALYNDFEVARTVNERIGERRIAFAGGGGEGSIHHGPAPYLLHIHFNIMPRGLAGQLVAGTLPPPTIDI